MASQNVCTILLFTIFQIKIYLLNWLTEKFICKPIAFGISIYYRKRLNFQICWAKPKNNTFSRPCLDNILNPLYEITNTNFVKLFRRFTTLWNTFLYGLHTRILLSSSLGSIVMCPPYHCIHQFLFLICL